MAFECVVAPNIARIRIVLPGRAACLRTSHSSCVFLDLGRLKRMSKKMRVVQVPRAGGPLELVERDIPEPERGLGAG